MLPLVKTSVIESDCWVKIRAKTSLPWSGSEYFIGPSEESIFIFGEILQNIFLLLQMLWLRDKTNLHKSNKENVGFSKKCLKLWRIWDNRCLLESQHSLSELRCKDFNIQTWLESKPIFFYGSSISGANALSLCNRSFQHFREKWPESCCKVLGLKTWYRFIIIKIKIIKNPKPQQTM